MSSYAVPMCTTPSGNRFPKDEKVKKAPITTIKSDEFECKVQEARRATGLSQNPILMPSF